MPGPGWIDACPTDKLGMGGLHPVNCGFDDLAVLHSDMAVMVEVVHDAVVVAVDEYVGRVAVHVTAECGTPLRIAPAGVVPRSAEAAHDPDPADVDAVSGQVLENELELIHELELEDEILRPDVRLIVSEEVTEHEVLGDVGIGVVLSDLNETGRVGVTRGGRLGWTDFLALRPLRRPVADVIEADLPSALGAERELVMTLKSVIGLMALPMASATLQTPTPRGWVSAGVTSPPAL